MAQPVRPLRIGLSSCFFHGDPQRPIFKGKTLLYLEQSLAHWVMTQNVLVYLIPAPVPKGTIRLHHYAMDLDGLILQGGSDISPKTYGEAPIRPEWSGDYIRDQYEIELMNEFMAYQKPVLGICRGAQLINVAFGGTLYQDIATQVQGAVVHRNWEIYDQLSHSITLSSGSGLAKLYPGIKVAKVNSVHHQGIKSLGNGLVGEARSEMDGIFEAIRLKADHYIFGVQWHPEFHDINDYSLLDGTPILIEFLKEARRRRGV